MRYILFILLFQFAICDLRSQNETQPGLRDYQISGATLPDSILFILGTDTLDGSAKQGLAKFYRADSLLSALGGDTDWWKLNTTIIPTNSDSMERTGYTLLNGLDGGLPTKIEFLKEGIIQFDKTGLYNAPAWLIRSNPLQDAHGVDPFGIVAFAGDNTGGDRKNDTYTIGINPSSIYDGTALYLSYEGHYQPTASDSAHEFHLVMRDILDNDRRIWTWFLPKDDPEGYTQSSYVQQFNLRDPNSITGDGLFFQSIRLNDEESSIRLLGSGSSAGGGAEGIEQFLHTGTGVEQFVIKPFGSMTSDVEMYVNQFNAFNIKRARISDDWGTLHGSDGNPAYLFGGESSFGGVVRVSWDEAIDSLIGNGINLTQNDWYKIGTTDAPTDITDNRYFTGNLAIGATTARGLLDVDNIYIGTAGAFHGYIRSADGIYLNTDYDNNGGDGSFHIQNSGTDVLALDDNGLIDANAYDGTPPTGTPFGILTHESDGDFISSDAGWGLSFSGGNVIADSSQVATQYDLTLISGGSDGNGIFDAANEADTIEINEAMIDPALVGFYLSSLGTSNDSYWSYQPFSGGLGMLAYDDQARPSIAIYNEHASYGTFASMENIGNRYLYGLNIGGDFYIQDGTIEPFYIEASTTVDNTLKLQADGDVQIADYPNSRDDGSPTNVLGTDASGVIQSYPVADVLGVTNLTIGGSGPTYTIESSTGTDVTIAAAGINTLSESPANTLIITGTEVDGSITNEIQTMDATGTTTVTWDLSDDATDISLTGAGISAVSRSGNAVTVTSTEVDGSTSNELNTIEEGNVSAQTGNVSIDFQSMFDVATDGGTEVNISFDGGEASTVTTAEADDYVLLWDDDAVNQKMLWSDFSETLISFYDGTSLQGTGNAIDVGEGLDINMVSTEANVNLDASEFQIDGTGEGTEYVLIHDIDTTAGHQIQRRLVSSFGGADGNGIYDGSGTVPTTTVATLTDNLTFNTGASEADLFIDGTNDLIGIGTNSPEQQLTISNEDSNLSYPIMAFHTDQSSSASSVLGRTEYLYGSEDLVKIVAQKQTSSGTNDAKLTITMEDAANADIDAIELDYEEGYINDFPRMRMFGGLQFARTDSVSTTQTLDESFCIVRVVASSITITLPALTPTNNESDGTFLVIYNTSAGDITIDPGSASDTVNGSSANFTLPTNTSRMFFATFTSLGNATDWISFN